MARIAYFDCLSGISGDMTLGALIDLGVETEAIESAVRSMGLPDAVDHHRNRQEVWLPCHFRQNRASRPSTLIGIFTTSQR